MPWNPEPGSLTGEELLLAFLSMGASVPWSGIGREYEGGGALSPGLSGQGDVQLTPGYVSPTATGQPKPGEATGGVLGPSYTLEKADEFGRSKYEKDKLSQTDPAQWMRDYIDPRIQQWHAGRRGAREALSEPGKRGTYARALQSSSATGGGAPLQRAFSLAAGASTPQQRALASQQRERDVNVTEALRAGALQHAQEKAAAGDELIASEEEFSREMPLAVGQDILQLLTTGQPGTSAVSRGAAYAADPGPAPRTSPDYLDALGSFYSV